MSSEHRVDVRDPGGFLKAVMEELAGDSCLSLEGTLDGCNFPEEIVLARDETDFLRRNTISPRLDFLVLRLEHRTVAPIYREATRVGLRRAIIHVQIEKCGLIELGAFDNFHPECVTTGRAVPDQLLINLKASRIVRSFAAIS
jgi:hypothetical protein